MLFDILLILILIFFFFKTTAQASLESFIWVLGVFITIRISGSFYLTLAELLRTLFSALDQRNSQYIAYIIMTFLVSFVYIFFLRPRIGLLAKFIPKKLLFAISYTFSIMIGFMLFVIIYAVCNSFPIIDKLPPKVRNARSDILVTRTLGPGTVEFVKTMRHGLSNLDNPLEFLKEQQKLLNKAGEKVKAASKSINDE